jgi:hypothetical protein
MTTDQIAAQAAEECLARQCEGREYTDIIKAAIEKAYREGWRVGRDFAIEGQRDLAENPPTAQEKL